MTRPRGQDRSAATKEPVSRLVRLASFGEVAAPHQFSSWFPRDAASCSGSGYLRHDAGRTISCDHRPRLASFVSYPQMAEGRDRRPTAALEDRYAVKRGD